jgi:methylmalonyl-CoA mutase
MKSENLFAEFPPASAEEWNELISRELKGRDVASLVWETFDGLKFEPFYTFKDLEKLESKEALPGNYPYLRGNKVYGNKWEIRQDIKVSDTVQANRKALDILNKGVTSLGFISPEASVSDLLTGILPEHISVNFLNSRKSLEILKSFIAEVKARKLQPSVIRGSVDYDFLGEMLLTGNEPDVKAGFDKAAEMVNLLTHENLSLFRGINISGNNYHHAGASIVQELAFSLSQGNEYLVRLTDRNLAIDDIASSIQFTFSTGSSYLMEIAKLRAFRMLWARIVEQYKPVHTCSMATYIHCITSGWNLAVADAYNNLLRATTETMSAAIGGANSIMILPYDSAWREPDDFSERIARNIQIICAEEAHLDKVADAAGGSYYIEKLTDSIAAAAWELFRKTESKGGFLAVAKSGFIQEEAAKTAKAKNEAVAEGKLVMVGVNKYINKSEKLLEKVQAEREREFRQTAIKRLKIHHPARTSGYAARTM